MLATKFRSRNGPPNASSLNHGNMAHLMQSEKNTLLSVRDLSVEFHTARGVVKAVNSVSLDIKAGERLAIVGESGSGKSIMSMSLLQLVQYPGRITSGSAMLEGTDLLALKGKKLRAVRGSKVTMIFQDPMTSLNPVLRVSEQLIAPMRRHLHLGQREAKERGLKLLAQVGIPDAEGNFNNYPHELSGGMRQRVLIAMAMACSPRLLIADEPTTALDVTIQAQIIELLAKVSKEEGSSVLFVTHDMGLVARFADRVAVMYGGRIIESGPTDQMFENPHHPYTRGLLESIPSITGERPERLSQIEGTPPDLAFLPKGCSFADRCPLSDEVCIETQPASLTVASDHTAACHHSDVVASLGERRLFDAEN